MKSQPQRIRGLNKDKIELQERIQNMSERKKYALSIFRLVIACLISICLILILCGCGVLKLSDTVIGILLGTTTSIFALFTLIVKYLFYIKT